MHVQPLTTDLVLVGGGHSHLSVIKQLGMKPLPGLRITVISRDIHTPYSGMVPGLIAGHYQHDDAHIDLRPLCQFANARLFHSSVNSIDLQQRQIHCDNRPPVRYDWLSINTGSSPDLASIPGAGNVGIAVKPIDTFLQHWQGVVESLKKHPREMTIAIVGGGAASVEVVLAVQYQLQQALGKQAHKLRFELLCSAPQLLTNHNWRVRKQFNSILHQRGVTIRTESTVTAAAMSEGKAVLTLNNGDSLHYDDVIWAIHAGSQAWIRNTGLSVDKKGFIDVLPTLQSVSHNNVFAAGDIAHFSAQPLAKSGVYAVRAGKVLAQNLRRAIQGKSLVRYRPQKHFLSLLMTGDTGAIGSKGVFSASGAWVWRIKDHIDRSFMTQFSELPTMQQALQSSAPNPPATDNQSVQQLTGNAMRCGGCGAKVNQPILSRVLARLEAISCDDAVMGLNQPDDAAVLIPPSEKHWVQSVDYFRAFVDDPYLLGRIASNHCLNDIYAMGASAHSALAIATVPHGSDTVVEDTLLQLMSGAVQTLNESQTALIGGHTSEGAELGFGLSVNGVIEKGRLLSKGTLTQGQKLILTKPIGTGTLLAANMLGKAQGRWIDNALEQMLISNQRASEILYQHRAGACTDITGFGLAGHLVEMLRAANLSAQLYLYNIPLLAGALYCAEHNWLSSLHTGNSQIQNVIGNRTQFANDNYYPLLFDPQTAGGLLAAVPAEQADNCIAALRSEGYATANVIAETTDNIELSSGNFVTLS